QGRELKLKDRLFLSSNSWRCVSWVPPFVWPRCRSGEALGCHLVAFPYTALGAIEQRERIGRFREAHLCGHALLHCKDKPAVDDVDQVASVRRKRSLNRYRAHPVGPVEENEMLGNAAWSSLLNSDIGTRSQENNRYDFTIAPSVASRAATAKPMTEAQQVLFENCLLG